MYQFPDDRFTFRGMEKNFKAAPLISILISGLATLISHDTHNRTLTIAVGVLAGLIAFISVSSWIFFLFRRRSVRTLIFTQGTLMTCILLSLLLMTFGPLMYENPFFTGERKYLILAYPLVAIVAFFYGRAYARRRWRSRAQWLGEMAKQGEQIDGGTLYNGFFETDGGNANAGRQITVWVGSLIVGVPLIDHVFGRYAVGSFMGGLVLWAASAMVSNLLVRSHYVRRYLRGRDMRIIAFDPVPR